MPAEPRSPHRRLALFLAAALVAAAPVAAGDSAWSVVAKAGQASASQDFGPPILGWRLDDDDTAAGIELRYALSRHLALAAGYLDLGSYPGQPRPCPPGDECPLTLIDPFAPVYPIEADITAWTLAVMPRLPVTDRFAVYGKLGLLAWQADLTRAFDRQPIDDPSANELLGGIGAELTFPSGFGLLLEFEASDLLTATTAGASWRF